MNRQPRVRRSAAARHRRRIWLVVAITALIAVAGATIYAIYEAQRPPAKSSSAPAASDDKTGLVVGTGPVTVELYADFLCPGCGLFERTVGDEITRLVDSNQIRLVYRPVAILDPVSTNQYSTRSAAGAACAADVGALMPYVKVLFGNQPAEGGPGHDDEQLIVLAGKAGITDPRFAQCVRDGRYLPWVKQATDAMAQRGIEGTPTVLVNGTRLQRLTPQALADAVAGAAG